MEVRLLAPLPLLRRPLKVSKRCCVGALAPLAAFISKLPSMVRV